MTMTDPGAELALRAQPVLPMSPDQARSVMRAYQDTCKAILTPDDVQRVGDREFTTRSGFQKLAAAYGVSTEIVSLDVTGSGVEEDPMIARAIVRAIHPSGRHAEGDGACSSHEKRFRKGDEKMDHSLPATAVTRAVNRAISNLVAFGSVSAEEARDGETGPPGPAVLPDWALPMRDIQGVAHNLTRILKAAGITETAATVKDIGTTVRTQADGEFPFIAARVVGLLANAVEYSGTIDDVTVTTDETTDEDAVEIDENQTTIDNLENTE